MDNRILSTIIEKFKGGPVGLTTIATAVGEQSGTIEEVYEPFLIQEGFLLRTPRGRQVTKKAYKHLDIEISNDSIFYSNLESLKIEGQIRKFEVFNYKNKKSFAVGINNEKTKFFKIEKN